jgi:hypothetical protein
MVPPLPHDAIADVIAGTSSIEEDPPALGVHVEARAFRMRVASGRAKLDAVTASRTSTFDIDMPDDLAVFDCVCGFDMGTVVLYTFQNSSNLRFIKSFLFFFFACTYLPR